MPYNIELKTSVVKALKHLPRNAQIKIAQKIALLADHPRPIYCIRMSDSPYYRIRCGDYRIIYDIQDVKLVVLILEIGHRKDVYQ